MLTCRLISNKKTIYLLIVLATISTIIASCKKNNLPELATDTISNITSTSVTCGGNISSNGGSIITNRGICWNTSGSPSIDDNHTLDGIDVGAFSSTITGLTLGETYYVRSYATNNNGTAYGNERSFTTAISIGDNAEGGVTFYLFQTGDPGYVEGEKHGLIVSEVDQGSAPWSLDFTLVGTTEAVLGSGPSNTSEIVMALGAGTYAASVCSNLTLNGYSDWYLPSKDELNLLYLNKEVVGNLASGYHYYHTSTESGSENMWVQDMYNGTQEVIGAGSKTVSYLIRPIRTF